LFHFHDNPTYNVRSIIKKKKATSFSVDFFIFFLLVFSSFLDQVEINRFFAKKIKKIKVQDCVKSASLISQVIQSQTQIQSQSQKPTSKEKVQVQKTKVKVQVKVQVQNEHELLSINNIKLHQNAQNQNQNPRASSSVPSSEGPAYLAPPPPHVRGLVHFHVCVCVLVFFCLFGFGPG
jgi:hypothetical protein